MLFGFVEGIMRERAEVGNMGFNLMVKSPTFLDLPSADDLVCKLVLS